jgi:hypothetical protein
MKNQKKESIGAKVGRFSKKLTKWFLIFALCYFAFRVFASILFNV